MPPTPLSGRVSGAFTLVEILVVVAIIGILAAIALVVGSRVTKGGERSLTENTLRVLDATLTAYQSERGKFPTYYVDGQNEIFPIVDGVLQGAPAGAKPEPTIAYYLLIAGDVPSVKETLKGLDSRLIARSKPVSRSLTPTRAVRDRQGNDVEGLIVNDAWGNPIRVVVPRYHGGHGVFVGAGPARPNLSVNITLPDSPPVSDEYTRSYRLAVDGTGTADEGLCPGGRPYFYSAGPDGDPGTREDNVYSIQPQFPLETRDLK